MIATAFATLADPHTTNGTVDPIAGLAVSLTLDEAGQLACLATLEVDTDSANWEGVRRRPVRAGRAPGEWWRQSRDTNPSGNPRYILSPHMVFPASAGPHTVTMESWDLASQQNATFHTRRLTVLSDVAASPGGEEPPPPAPPPPPDHPFGTLPPLIAALQPGDTLALSGSHADDLDLRGAPSGITVSGPATVQLVYTDGPVELVLRDLTMRAIRARRQTWIGFAGACAVEGWDLADFFGIQDDGFVRLGWADDGSLTVTGPGAGWGIHLLDHSSFPNAVGGPAEPLGDPATGQRSTAS